MRAFAQLPKTVLILEVIGIVLLVLAMLSVNQWLTLPAILSGRGAATLMFLIGVLLMLPAAATLMWRTAQALAPQLLNPRKTEKKPTQSGDSHDADH